MRKIILILALLLLCGIVSAALGEGIEATVYMGTWQQNSDFPELIPWRVLDVQDGHALLLSENALASCAWHNTHEAVTWDQSDIREWLNEEFLRNAFIDVEQAAIVPVELDNGDVLGYGTPVGENTRDRVFLLSGDEVLRYLPTDEARVVEPTGLAIFQGAYTNGEGHCAWWLRSPGMTPTGPAYLSSGGSIGSRAHEVDETIIGVRPAMWVDIASLSEDTEITATGVVTYVGTDIHGLPSFRLSDSADGECLVHACLDSEAEYGDVQVGDTVTVTGNFHVLSDDWGVVLKHSVRKRGMNHG